MSAFNYPVLDGVAPSWADVQIRIAQPGGRELIGMGDIIQINSGATAELGRQKEGGRTIKRTHGDGTEEASITLYLSGYRKMLRGIKSAAPQRHGQRLMSLVAFNIIQIYSAFGDPEIFERRIMGCRIIGNAHDVSEGPDAARVVVPLDPMQVVDIIDGEECVLV